MTTLLICLKPPRGVERTPFHIVCDPEFIPNVGDFLTHESLRYEVLQRDFQYAATVLTESQSHVVVLTVKSSK